MPCPHHNLAVDAGHVYKNEMHQNREFLQEYAWYTLLIISLVDDYDTLKIYSVCKAT